MKPIQPQNHITVVCLPKESTCFRTARNHLLIEIEDARPEENAKDYEIDPKQVSGKLKKILNEILNEMKSYHKWGEWGAWGDCCTGNLELKKGGGLKYSDNPEAVQVRHR